MHEENHWVVDTTRTQRGQRLRLLVKILITNYRLDEYSGTEVVVRDLVLELRRQGHEPLVYSPRPGPVADEIRAEGIEVVSDLGRLTTAPDMIHGHHHAEFMDALRWFPLLPAIYVCHDALSNF